MGIRRINIIKIWEEASKDINKQDQVLEFILDATLTLRLKAPFALTMTKPNYEKYNWI